MKFANPATRAMLLLVTFFLLLLHIGLSWGFARFGLATAQNRTLDPKYYDVQVVSAADYRRLADPAAPKVTLADGTTVEKAPAWHDLVLPGYKPTPNGEQYVLITTKGTGHVLSYLEPILMLLGTLAACGLGLSVWNLSLIQKKPADA